MKKKILLFVSMFMLILAILAGCSQKKTELSNEVKKEDTKKEEKQEEVKETSAEDALIKEAEESLEKALGKKPNLNGGEKIGVLISSTGNEFWSTMKTRYEEAGKELGIEVKVFEAKAEDDAEGQLEVLNTMIPMGFKAIILSPINGTNLIQGIVEANKNNIPVINLGPGVDKKALEGAGGHLDGRITVKFENQGQLVAEDMVKRLNNKGKVVILEGLAGAAQSEGRTKGAREVFEKTDGIELVASQACDWKAERAYEATKDILTANPEINGLFACNDNMALAALRALEETGKKDVLVYGVDFTSDAKKSIADKKLMGTMTYSSALYTKAAEEMALILAQGGKFESPIFLPLTLVTRDNIEAFSNWK